MKLVRADAAVLTRMNRADGKARYIARSDSQSGKVFHAPQLSCAPAILGESVFSARPGSIWKLSECDAGSADGGGSRLTACVDNETASASCEVIVVPLANDVAHSDHLELHFRRPPLAHNIDLISILASTLGACWAQRSPGAVSKRLGKKRLHLVSVDRENSQLSILDVENPAGLSRSEFRICTMLKEGMTVKMIAEALAVCQATVRSHLSSIFSKTGTSSQVELLFELNHDRFAVTRASA